MAVITVFNEVNIYLDGLPKKIPDDQFPFIKSSLGSTGITFLPKDFNFKWVVKWQNPALTETEFTCTQFYKRAFTDLSVPEAIYPLPEALVKKFQVLFKAKSISDQYVPMLLEFKRGNNLNKLFENRLIFQLPDNELESLFTTFGMIAGFDSLIANYDRFLPHGYRGKVDQTHSANGGNVMVEFCVPESFNSAQASLKSVYVIDISPHSLLFFDPKERKVEEIEAEGIGDLGGMFGEEEEVSVITTERVSIGESLRKDRAEDFRYFMSISPDRMQDLAQQVAIGIRNEWADKYPNRISEVDQLSSKSAISEGLEKGLLFAQSKITKARIGTVLDRLKHEGPFVTKSPQIVLEFVEENLELTKI